MINVVLQINTKLKEEEMDPASENKSIGKSLILKIKKNMNSKNLIIACFACLFSIFTITSCTKDDNNLSNNTQSEVQRTMQEGNWKITKFIDSGKEETNHFTGYTFTFSSSSVLNATNGTNNYNGTWSITDSKSNDDSQGDLDFNINFNLTNDFEDLNDDWDFISQSSTKIELIDVSGGNGGTDYLTFEKK
jgi:hypothetical protein